MPTAMPKTAITTISSITVNPFFIRLIVAHVSRKTRWCLLTFLTVCDIIMPQVRGCLLLFILGHCR